MINLIFLIIFLSPSIGYFVFLKIKLKEKSTIQKLIHKVGFCIVIIMNISGMIFINNKLSNQNEITKNLEQQKFTKEQEEKEQETIQVAKSLLNFLRNSGLNEELVINVRPTAGRRMVSVIVTNAWLRYPDYEQKQMKQTIKLALVKIVHPDGYPFEILDYLGNKI